MLYYSPAIIHLPSIHPYFFSSYILFHFHPSTPLFSVSYPFSIHPSILYMIHPLFLFHLSI
jgi:hypothetical protein